MKCQNSINFEHTKKPKGFLLTQKEILNKIKNSPNFSFNYKSGADAMCNLQRQEAIKECKIIIKRKYYYLTYSMYKLDYLREYYSITDEELR